MSPPKRKEENESAGPLRIGTVPYCESWPLVHFLQNELPGTILSEWIPSTMRFRLMAHHLDLALMPVAELMNLPHGKIVGNGCIASRGAVRSVWVLSHKPIGKIETLSLDSASSSSVAMCDVILRHFYDLRPTRYRLSPEKPLDSCKTDALLMIGDQAWTCPSADRWEYRYDLGELWREKTGLPFVFAAWIGCSERVWSGCEILRGLSASRDRGLEKIDAILDERERSKAFFPASREEVRSYLTESIVYRLGEEELRGMQSFFDLALLHGLAKHRTVVEVLEPTD